MQPLIGQDLDLSAYPLTRREKEVLQYLIAGRSAKYTAFELGISVRTVEVYRSSLYRKLGVRNAMSFMSSLCHETLRLAARPVIE